jgi:acyl-CoA hydrolase
VEKEAKKDDDVEVSQQMTPAETATVMTHIVEGANLAADGHLKVGFILRLMDLCACGCAEKLSQRPSVTLSMDDLDFRDTKLKPGNHNAKTV